MNYQKEILYDVDWQKLRVSTLAQFNDYGGWNSIEGVKKNIQILSNYLTGIKSPEETYRRAWRVLNMLNATRMGYSGQGKAKSAEDKLVENFRDRVQTVYKKYKSLHKETEWDWDKVKKDLVALYKTDQKSFDNIYKNLTQRKTTTEKTRGTLANRPELEKFLTIMNSIK